MPVRLSSASLHCSNSLVDVVAECKARVIMILFRLGFISQTNRLALPPILPAGIH